MPDLNSPGAADSPLALARDVAAVQAISAVPSLLRIICQMTGMGFAAVARVTDGTWTACAVEDLIKFGLQPGGQLPLRSTLCFEAREMRQPIAFDHASSDPRYKDHHTPRLYNIESYISVPIVLADGEYFGNLCAIDPQPHAVSGATVVEVFERFAMLIGMELDSQRHRQQVEMQLLNERQTAELREHFVAVLGHDLKNPIASLAMAGEVLARGDHGPQAKVIGANMRSTTKRMAKLVDDVLDFTKARLGGGLDTALVEHHALGADIAAVVEELRTAHPHRSIHARIGITRPIVCDPLRIQQLVSNLVANGLTYGASGQPVMIEVDLVGEFMEIAVLNEGDSIPLEVQAKMFEPYWRAQQGQADGNLGLGLYICAQIVKAHKGKISVNSSADGGTMFLAQLPIR